MKTVFLLGRLYPYVSLFTCFFLTAQLIWTKPAGIEENFKWRPSGHSLCPALCMIFGNALRVVRTWQSNFEGQFQMSLQTCFLSFHKILSLPSPISFSLSFYVFAKYHTCTGPIIVGGSFFLSCLWLLEMCTLQIFSVHVSIWCIDTLIVHETTLGPLL